MLVNRRAHLGSRARLVGVVALGFVTFVTVRGVDAEWQQTAAGISDPATAQVERSSDPSPAALGTTRERDSRIRGVTTEDVGAAWEAAALCALAALGWLSRHRRPYARRPTTAWFFSRAPPEGRTLA